MPQESSRWRLRLFAGAGALVVAGAALWGAWHAIPDVSGTRVRCADFRTHDAAQRAFLAGATQLDGDRDGIACERLR